VDHRFLILVAIVAPSLGCGGEAKSRAGAEGFVAGQRGKTSYAVQAPARPTTSQGPRETEAPAPGLLEPLGPILNADTELDEVIASALAAAVATSDSDPARVQVERAIAARAAALGVSMKPSGPPWFADLRRGGHAVAVFELASGGCYAFVGSASQAVVAFQINLVTGPPRPPQVLAQSNAAAAPAVGTSECLRNETGAALEVYVDLSLVRGEGIVGAQAFRDG
jgi:hypothetical protein